MWTSEFTAPSVIILENVFLLLAALVVCGTSWHWLMRLTAVFAAAIGLSVAESLAVGVLDEYWYLTVTNLFQAVVLMAWLELTPILRRASLIEGECVEASRAATVQNQSE
jgi:hypothetical protein